jgi:hypothetical protein
MAMHLRGEGRIMNTTYNTKTKRLTAALVVAATAVMAPALLFASAGTAQADDPCYDGSLAGSYYCSPASQSGIYSQTPEPLGPFSGPPSPNLWDALPQCTGGVLAALDGDCS